MGKSNSGKSPIVCMCLEDSCLWSAFLIGRFSEWQINRKEEKEKGCDNSMEPANEWPTDRVTTQESVCIHGYPERGTRGRGVVCFLPEHQGDVRSCSMGSCISKCKLEEHRTFLTQGAGPAGCPNLCTICKKATLPLRRRKGQGSTQLNMLGNPSEIIWWY